MPAQNVAPVVLTFICEGEEAIKRVFASVEATMGRAERSSTQTQRRASSERVRGARQESESVADAHVKSTEKWMKARERIRENSFRMEQRLREREVSDERRAEEDKTRAVERESKKRAGLVAAEARRTASEQRSYSRLMATAGIGGVGGLARGAASFVAGTLGIGAGFELANLYRKSASFERTVAQASNVAYIPGTTTREQVSPEVIARMSRTTQAFTNFDKEDVAKGIQRYVGLSSDFEGLSGKTGTRMGGKELTGLDELGVLAKASGTNFESLMEGAAAIKANNPGMSAKDLLSTVRTMIGAGKKGTIPLDQLANYVGEIQATAGRFTGSTTAEGMQKNQAGLLGLVQLAGRKTGGDVARAAMSVKDFTSDIMKEGIKKGGMSMGEIYQGGDPTKGIVSADQLIANVFGHTKGRPDLLGKVFGQRSMPLMEAFNDTFNTAEAKKKGSGKEAVAAQAREFMSVSYSADDTMKEFAEVMNTNGERIDLSLKKIQEVAEARFAPFLERMSSALQQNEPQIEKFLNAIADVAGFMTSHPWASLFAVMEARMLSSIGEAAIGQAVTKALAGELTVGAAKAIATSTPMLMGIIGAAAAAAIAGGIAMIDKAADSDKTDQQKSAILVAKSGNLAAKVAAGTATPVEVEQAKIVKKQLEDLNEKDKKHNAGWTFGRTLSALGISDAGEERDKQELKTHQKSLDDLRNAINANTKALAGNPGVAPGAGGAGPRGGTGTPALPANHPARNVSQSHPARGGPG